MQQEVRTLVIRHATVRVVRILALLEVDDEALIAGLALVQLEGIIQSLGADEVREAALARPVKLLEQKALDVRRPALVQPEMCRVGVPGEMLG